MTALNGLGGALTIQGNSQIAVSASNGQTLISALPQIVLVMPKLPMTA
ncbi:MAG: hypothetical protein R3B12_01060 [Candidatus Saccharimonadales bacterium]